MMPEEGDVCLLAIRCYLHVLPAYPRPTPSTPLHQEIPDHPERILLYILAKFPVIPAGNYPEVEGGGPLFYPVR